MEGVTILSEQTNYYDCAFVMLLVIGIGILALSILAIKAFFSSKSIFGVATSAIIAFVACLLIAGSVLGIIYDDTTRYKVVVDESVNFEEFAKRYEVVSNDGQIWDVELKNEEGIKQ